MLNKRTTIKDVAKEAGVTHTTVSRVIHNDPRISEPTKIRVRKAIQLLRYEPNLIARGLVNSKTQVIALITPDLDPFTLPVVRSVAESCAANKYATMLFPTNTWTQENMSFDWVSANWLVDGILIYNLVYHENLPPEILRLQDRKLPFVFVNKYLQQSSINAVGVDNDHAVSLAIDHLVERGHRNIGLLYGDVTSVDGMERVQAFKNALQRNGLAYNETFTACAMWRDTDACDVMHRLLQKPAPPTAFFCANDLMAIGAIKAVREKGLRVPEDVAFVGFDDLEAGRYVTPSLTTIRPPLFEAGRRAFDLLRTTIQDPHRPAEQIKLQAELIVRQSTSPGTC